MNVEIETDGKSISIEIKLFGSSRKMTIEDLDISLDMVSFADKFEDKYVNAIKAVPNLRKDEWNQVWKSLAKTMIFKRSESNETELKTAALTMCHHILAINFCGKKDSSNNVSQSELYILWEIENKLRLNFSAFVAAHVKNILSKPRQRLSFSPLPIIFGKQLKLFKIFKEKKENEEHIDMPTLQ